MQILSSYYEKTYIINSSYSHLLYSHTLSLVIPLFDPDFLNKKMIFI